MTKDETREQLVELISEAQDCGCDVTDVVDMIYVENEVLADHLLARGVTVQTWIPVSERLPKEGQSVLVYRVSKKMIAPHVSLCTYHGAREKNEWSRRTDHVMYWMPLPKPPKENDNA